MEEEAEGEGEKEEGGERRKNGGRLDYRRRG